MASECGAFIHALHSSGSVRITGIAFGCMGATTAFGAAVRKPYRSFKVSPSFSFLTDVQRVQMPAKNPTGLSSLRANHTGSGGFPAYSEKLVKGTRQRFSTPIRGCFPTALPCLREPVRSARCRSRRCRADPSRTFKPAGPENEDMGGLAGHRAKGLRARNMGVARAKVGVWRQGRVALNLPWNGDITSPQPVRKPMILLTFTPRNDVRSGAFRLDSQHSAARHGPSMSCPGPG